MLQTWWDFGGCSMQGQELDFRVLMGPSTSGDPVITRAHVMTGDHLHSEKITPGSSLGTWPFGRNDSMTSSASQCWGIPLVFIP